MCKVAQGNLPIVYANERILRPFKQYIAFLFCDVSAISNILVAKMCPKW